MSLRSWIENWARIARGVKSPATKAQRQQKTQLRLEPLEDRTVPATFVVNTLGDTVDSDPNITSLREALTAANSNSDLDRIEFHSSLAENTISLTQGQLSITNSVVIDGDLDNDGTPDITVARDANASDFSVFSINDSDNSTNFQAVLDGLIITGGRATFGGGIVNRENLTVINSRLTGNTGTFQGGAIQSEGGSLQVINSTIDNNNVVPQFGDGGGISMPSGNLRVENSTIRNNSSGYGGGIETLNGSITVTSSTISDNTARINGGGIYTWNGPLTVTDSTLSGNVATRDTSLGGGMFHRNGTLNVVNTTISGNSAVSGGGIALSFGNASIRNTTITGNAADQGGGIFSRATVSVVSSVNAGNKFRPTTLFGTGAEFYSRGNTGTIANNVLGDNSYDFFSGFVRLPLGANNFIGSADRSTPTGLNAILDPTLADNGGPTFTHKLVSGSPAINRGSNPDNLTSDQRGTGFARVSGTAIDSGAYELQLVAPALSSIVLNPTSISENGGVAVGTITLTGPTDRDVTITLTSDDTSEATVPSSVTILEGNDSATFTVTGVNDNLDDNDQIVNLAISVPGDGNYQQQVIVTDDDTTPVVSQPIADVTVLEDANPLTFDLSAVFSDADQTAGSLTFTAQSNNASLVATSVDNGTDVLTLTFQPDQHGTAQITVTATDSTGLSVSDIFVVTVTSVNDAPVASNDPFTTNEDTSISGNVLTNDSDIDGDSLQANLVSGTSNGTLTLNADGSFQYTPNANFHGSDSFTYQVNDGNANSNIATATIAVLPVNDAPTFDLAATSVFALVGQSVTKSRFATNIHAGAPNESSQQLGFQLTPNNPSAFTVAPTIDPTTGQLTFKLSDSAPVGRVTVSVVLVDDGGTANGG